MKKISEEIKVANYATFKRYLINLIGEEKYNNIAILMGGEEFIVDGSFGMSEDSGTAYEGALVEMTLSIADYAKKINELLPEDKRVKNSSIYKVALLQHIAKSAMYIENDNEWEVKNRGIYYKFNDDIVTPLRCGERSILLTMTAGVRFTDEEFEAMRSIDKINEGDNASRWYGSTLTTLIRQANEIVTMIAKK